ncbi:MAG TPA: hypothetical protein VEH76_10040 [Methylocystis sp.]|nr:hypothetical protein [Methylocystis sp.]
MSVGKILLVCAILLSALESSSRAAPTNACKEPEPGSKAASILSPPFANVVTGQGRLQFYSAPNIHCPMAGVFVIPKDDLVSYVETDDGWTSVMYVNPRSGDHVEGWVRSARLKKTGTAGPSW